MSETNKISTYQHVKPHATCKVSQLKPEQRKKLACWLFERNFSYRHIQKLAVENFNVKLSRNSVMNFYHKEFSTRNKERFVRSVKNARGILKLIGDDKNVFYEAMLQVVAQIAFEHAAEPGQGRKPMYKMLMQAMPMLMEAHKSSREQQKVALDRERWEFDVVRMCREHFRELQAIIVNQSLDEPSRLQEIRRRLFGKNLLPEKC